MKISLHKKTRILASFILSFYTPFVLADGLTTKSMLVSVSIPLIGAAYSYTNADFEGLKQLGLASLVTAQLTTLLKNSVNRTRPNGENNLSFPSGHTAAAFVGASYLHHRYGLVWGIPMYALASVIGYQRVNVKDHYWSDVIAGAALGYGAGAFFTSKYPNVWLEPRVDTQNGFYGMQLNARF